MQINSQRLGNAFPINETQALIDNDCLYLSVHEYVYLFAYLHIKVTFDQSDYS